MTRLDKGFWHADQLGETTVQFIAIGCEPQADILEPCPALTASATRQCRTHRHPVARPPIGMASAVDNLAGKFMTKG